MYQFPHITHLNDIRHAISEDFYLAERDWGFVINYYIGAFPEINDSMSEEEKSLEYIRREFRGIKFDVNGNLIARPFSKFFNWGEKEAEMKQYDFSQPFVIMDKLDGCLSGDTIVKVKHKKTGIEQEMSLSSLVDDENISEFQIWSYNEDSKTDEFCNVLNKLNKNGNKKWVKLDFDHGSILCTEDHQFLTTGGWCEAKDLEGKELLSF